MEHQWLHKLRNKNIFQWARLVAFLKTWRKFCLKIENSQRNKSNKMKQSSMQRQTNTYNKQVSLMSTICRLKYSNSNSWRQQQVRCVRILKYKNKETLNRLRKLTRPNNNKQMQLLNKLQQIKVLIVKAHFLSILSPNS